jgi:flavodoxin
MRILRKEVKHMNNTLIVYYSLVQNTANLALEIAIQTGGDIRELIPEKNYSFNYNTAAKEVRNQITRGFCPKLISGNESIEDYETIFIGSPNWFKTLAPPVMSFLKQHDFTGKTVIPFCTHGGGGFGEIENVIAQECSKSVILPGFDVNGTATSEEITNWLEKIGYQL